MSYKEKLLSGEYTLGIWGAGYVGLTAAVAFAQAGVKVLCYDTDPKVVDAINTGKCLIPNLEDWMGVTIKDVWLTDNLEATSDVNNMLLPQVKVHLIAVPTERDGRPWFGALESVFKILEELDKECLIIVESTLIPRTSDNIIHKCHLVVAPRRDFFNSPELNLKNLPRVFAGDTPTATMLGLDVLSIVCDKLIEADNLLEAELVKSVENSLLHVPAVYAIQLARAYPSVDMRKVLKLASTHWRIPLYYPSMGTGGYCIPLSSHYILRGAENIEELSISRAVIQADNYQPLRIMQILQSKGVKTLFVLGICFKGDLKVHKVSPAIAIAKCAMLHGIKILAYDPYYKGKEITELLPGATPAEYPVDLAKVDAVIIVPDHKMFKDTDNTDLFRHLKPGQIILDNMGVWENHREDFENIKVIYHVIGDAGWTLE